MAQPALHFAIGASCGTLLSLVIGPIRRRWYRLGPLTAILAGLWACLPDIDHLWRKFPWLPWSHTIGTWEYRHADSLLYDLFFFHGWLDRHLAGWGTIPGLAVVVLLCSLFFWLLGRRIATLENEDRVRLQREEKG